MSARACGGSRERPRTKWVTRVAPQAKTEAVVMASIALVATGGTIEVTIIAVSKPINMVRSRRDPCCSQGSGNSSQWRTSRLWARGEREASIRLAERYARRRPSDPWAWIVWGSWLMHAGRHDEAEAVFREGMAIHPESVELTFQLTESMLRQSKIQDARSFLERARESHPDSRFRISVS